MIELVHHPWGMEDARGNKVTMPVADGLRWTLRGDTARQS
jgi:hypothetical protein